MSAPRFRDLPDYGLPEFGLLGRSNVGKSSFLNAVFRNKRLARTAKTPGKTAFANCYRLSDETIWTDLPGYGYARVSAQQTAQWSELIREYCEKRPTLCGVLFLMDIRHPGHRLDCQALSWLQALNRPVFPIATKSDKLPFGKRQIHLRLFQQTMALSKSPLAASTHDSGFPDTFWKAFLAWRTALPSFQK